MFNAITLANATDWIDAARNAEQVRSLSGRLQRVLHRYFGADEQEQALHAVAHVATHLYPMISTPWDDVEWLDHEDLDLARSAQANAAWHLQQVPSVAAEAIRDENLSPSYTLLALEQAEDNLGDATGMLGRDRLQEYADIHLSKELSTEGELSKVINAYLCSVPLTDEGTDDTIEDIVSWCAFLPPVVDCSGAQDETVGT